MRAKHAYNSYKCITRLIVTGTRHYYAGWAWFCTNFVHGAQNAPPILYDKRPPPQQPLRLLTSRLPMTLQCPAWLRRSLSRLHAVQCCTTWCCASEVGQGPVRGPCPAVPHRFGPIAQRRGGVPEKEPYWGQAEEKMGPKWPTFRTVHAQGEPQAQCARSATIWASGRTRDPYFEILGAPRGIMVTPSGGFARCSTFGSRHGKA